MRIIDTLRIHEYSWPDSFPKFKKFQILSSDLLCGVTTAFSLVFFENSQKKLKTLENLWKFHVITHSHIHNNFYNHHLNPDSIFNLHEKYESIDFYTIIIHLGQKKILLWPADEEFPVIIDYDKKELIVKLEQIKNASKILSSSLGTLAYLNKNSEKIYLHSWSLDKTKLILESPNQTISDIALLSEEHLILFQKEILCVINLVTNKELDRKFLGKRDNLRIKIDPDHHSIILHSCQHENETAKSLINISVEIWKYQEELRSKIPEQRILSIDAVTDSNYTISLLKENQITLLTEFHLFTFIVEGQKVLPMTKIDLPFTFQRLNFDIAYQDHKKVIKNQILYWKNQKFLYYELYQLGIMMMSKLKVIDFKADHDPKEEIEKLMMSFLGESFGYRLKNTMSFKKSEEITNSQNFIEDLPETRSNSSMILDEEEEKPEEGSKIFDSLIIRDAYMEVGVQNIFEEQNPEIIAFDLLDANSGVLITESLMITSFEIENSRVKTSLKAQLVQDHIVIKEIRALTPSITVIAYMEDKLQIMFFDIQMGHILWTSVKDDFGVIQEIKIHFFGSNNRIYLAFLHKESKKKWISELFYEKNNFSLLNAIEINPVIGKDPYKKLPSKNLNFDHEKNGLSKIWEIKTGIILGILESCFSQINIIDINQKQVIRDRQLEQENGLWEEVNDCVIINESCVGISFNTFEDSKLVIYDWFDDQVLRIYSLNSFEVLGEMKDWVLLHFLGLYSPGSEGAKGPERPEGAEFQDPRGRRGRNFRV